MTNETNQTTATSVNPDVANGTSLNTKPVTAAARKAKAGAHGKSKRKLDNATVTPVEPTPVSPVSIAQAAAKAVGMKGKAVKAVGNAASQGPTSMFQLDKWPSEAGPAPNDYDLARGYAFTHCIVGRPSKKVIGAASYLRPDSGKYLMRDVTDGLWLAMGGDHGGGTRGDEMRNVASLMVRHGYITKSTPLRGGAYQTVVTPKGEARWATFKALHPNLAFDDPYDAAVKAAAEKAAKKALAAEKAKATREAKKAQPKPDKAITGHIDHMMPSGEPTVAAGEPNGDGATLTAPNDENAQVTG